MNWTIYAVGKPKLAYARDGIEEYAGRLRNFASVKLETVKAGTREAESAALLQKSEGQWRIALDERGEHLGSAAFANKIALWEQKSVKGIAILIGGADGHSPKLREQADWVWSLSALTLQHELALVVLYEQLYRAYSIKAGLPYHRE